MALKVAMHNWMRPEPIETTIRRLARFGYDGIEITGEPALYDAKQVRSLHAEIASTGGSTSRSKTASSATTTTPDACPNPHVQPDTHPRSVSD